MDKSIPFLGSGHEGAQNRSETLLALEAIVRETMYGFENLHYGGLASDAEAVEASLRYARLQAAKPEKIAVSQAVVEPAPAQPVPQTAPEASQPVQPPDELTAARQRLEAITQDAADYPVERIRRHFNGDDDETAIAA